MLVMKGHGEYVVPPITLDKNPTDVTPTDAGVGCEQTKERGYSTKRMVFSYY